MDCLTVNREELAEKYLQGKLDSVRQDEFETHLLECPKCTQELELLQDVRRDLAWRAHEIRGWTASRPFFRWQTAALAMVLLIALAVGIKQLRESKKGSDSAEITPKKEKDEPKPLVAEAAKSDEAGESPVSLSTPPQFPSERPGNKRVTHRAPSQAPVISDLPTPATPKQDIPTQLPPGGEVPPVPVVSQSAARNVNPANNSNSVEPTRELTTAQGVELARIGMVEAPPYTFPGMALHLKLPKDNKSGGFAKGQGAPGAGRELFQRGMNKYVDGHYSEAAGYLEQAVQLEPGAADINYYLGICKLVQGHPEESVVPLKNAAAAGQSIYLQPSHYYLAKAYVQGNKFADAEEEFRKAIAVPGRLTSDAQGLLARLQTLRGQIEKP